MQLCDVAAILFPNLALKINAMKTIYAITKKNVYVMIYKMLMKVKREQIYKFIQIVQNFA